MSLKDLNKRDVRELLSLEWLVTNGLGGYASASIVGANTRKYHGLLVASLNPPVNRQVLVNRAEEFLLTQEREFIPLTSNQYPGSVYPEGFRHLEEFSRNPIPTFRYRTKAGSVSKSIFMPYGSNTTVVEYANSGDKEIRLSIHPLFNDRDFHGLTKENSDFQFEYEQNDTYLKVKAAHWSTPVFWSFSKGKFSEDRTWYKDMEYLRELDRGFSYNEDAYQVGYVEATLQPGEVLSMIYTIEESMLKKNPSELKNTEIERLKNLVPAGVKNSFYQDLIVSADQFMVYRKSTKSHTILAGYHWFTDWGRDTMIAMLGGTIALDKKEESASIIRTFLRYLDHGMIPNRFPDNPNGEPEYNTIDGTLWLFVAVYECFQKFKDVKFLESVSAQLEDILNHHIAGTRFNIHATKQGFLSGGDANTQLTWMDVKIGDFAVTPRYGCPVEINALWYNALKVYEFVAKTIGKPSNPVIANLAKKVEDNFESVFWNEAGYLNDVYYESGRKDSKIRPNQLYAISLPFALISTEKQLQVVETVKEHLLTTLGMRTLSPKDPEFRANYGGSTWDRDTAYHQGTVWPFLIGEYMMALLKANEYSAESVQECKAIIDGFQDHFYNNTGIHCISEILDGKEPKQGKGTIQQAWSVTALIRVLDRIGLLQ
jgi:predicted glycogen debranching enzyme